jgi:hypothetical protein
MTWSLRRIAVAIYLVLLAAYAGTSNTRLRAPSSDPHFVYMADMWLHGRLDLGRPAPPTQNDWAEVETLELKDGRTVRGMFLRSQPGRFRLLGGKTQSIADTDIVSRSKKFYVSFPPFPAVLFLPLVALFGLKTNDVAFTVLLAPLGPMLLFLFLRRLCALGRSLRSVVDDLWLTGLFALGSVYFYSSVLGQVWYTAHIVATLLGALFLHASLEARRPILSGLLLGAMVLTRPQMGFFGVVYLYELWRVAAHDRGRLVRGLLLVGLPVVLLGAAGAAFNYARFGALSEFGHSFLNVRWTDRIQRYGLFNYAFLSRNLAVALTLLPKLLPKAPYFQISWHGLSLLVTTPALACLLWPRETGPYWRALWLAAGPIALLGLLYQNDGWVQFGYRFSLDYMLLLVTLLAVGRTPLSRPVKGLILVGVAVNLFGAITFGRAWQFYFDGFFAIQPGEY